jgi:hypothetical protein
VGSTTSANLDDSHSTSLDDGRSNADSDATSATVFDPDEQIVEQTPSPIGSPEQATLPGIQGLEPQRQPFANGLGVI